MPAESTRIWSERPCAAILCRNTPCAVGLRQMLPIQTKRTEERVMAVVQVKHRSSRSTSSSSRPHDASKPGLRGLAQDLKCWPCVCHAGRAAAAKLWQQRLARAACRTLRVESGKPPHSQAMVQEDSKKCTAAVASQPTLRKSDRLLDRQFDLRELEGANDVFELGGQSRVVLLHQSDEF